jgi:hypothetical protein
VPWARRPATIPPVRIGAEGGMVVRRVLGALALAGPAVAFAGDGLDALRSALVTGVPNVETRARYEHVEQDSVLDAADAYTVRARLGYTTARWNSLSLLTEFEGTFAFGAEAYNSGTNGNTARAVIADPKGTELNQLVLTYGGVPHTILKLGRQRIALDNQRFVGNSGWRQNEVTFDAVSIVNKSLPGSTLTYAFLARTNTTAYADYQLQGHVINVDYALAGWLTTVAYGYLLDFDTDPAPTALSRQFDTRTFGLRGTGARNVAEPVNLVYVVEFARQNGWKDAPSFVAASYWLGEFGASAAGITGKLGYECLEGDGSYGFQAPLGTLHAFQGWADQFLTTPRTGIRDAYLRVDADVPSGIKLSGFAHDFRPDSGGGRYGDEFDLQAGKTIVDGFSVLLKYADYRASDHAVAAAADTRKIWAQAEYRF